jgi:hypothetical protein
VTILRVVPWPKRLRDLGRLDRGCSSARSARARLRRDIGNGIGLAPAGTLGHVKSAGNGWHLLSFEADPCPCCRVKWRCGKLSKDDLELIEEGAGGADQA